MFTYSSNQKYTVSLAELSLFCQLDQSPVPVTVVIESIESNKSDRLRRLMMAFIRWKFLFDKKANRRSFVYHSAEVHTGSSRHVHHTLTI